VLAPARIAAGGTGVVALRLTAPARRALRRRGSAVVTVKVVLSGHEATIVAAVKARLKRGRARR
jgi:hypothetical protein